MSDVRVVRVDGMDPFNGPPAKPITSGGLRLYVWVTLHCAVLLTWVSVATLKALDGEWVLSALCLLNVGLMLVKLWYRAKIVAYLELQ